MLCSMSFYREREELISKVKYCIGSRERNYAPGATIDFPLTDILFQLYKKALLESDTVQNDEVSILIELYKNDNPEFSYTVEDLISRGWVETCYGHYHIIGHHTHKGQDETWKDCTADVDADILRFILWVDDQSDMPVGKYWIKVEDLTGMLDQWRAVCDSVPKIDWFFDNNFVERIGDKAYLSEGRHSSNITKAMARLWDYVSSNEDVKVLSEKWFRIAFQIGLSPEVVDYVRDNDDYKSKERLLQTIATAVENDSKYVSGSSELDKFINAAMFCYYKGLDLSRERFEKFISDENRVFRNYTSPLHEDTYICQYRKRWGDYFYLGSIINNIGYVELMGRKHVYKLLKIYSDSDRITTSNILVSGESILEMMLHSETFYPGAKLLLSNVPMEKTQIREYVSSLCDVIEKVFDFYAQRTYFPETRDILDVMLYLVHQNKCSRKSDTYDNPYYCVYKHLMDLGFKRNYGERISNGVSDYFKAIMESEHSDVEHSRCFYLLAEYTDKALDAGYFAGEIIDVLLQTAYESMYRVLVGENDGLSHFIDVRVFKESFSREIFERHISVLPLDEKKTLFGFDYSDEKKQIKYFEYRLKISIVFLTKASSDEEALALLEELLDKIMITTSALNYDNIVMYDMDGVIKAAFESIKTSSELFKSFLDKLLGCSLYELVLFSGLFDDDVVVEAIIKEISKIVSRSEKSKLVPEINNEKYVDCVLEREIECLYPYIESYLNNRLSFYKNRGFSENSTVYLEAESLKKRFLYISGRFEELRKTGDTFFLAVMTTHNISSVEDYKMALHEWRLILDGKDRKKYSFSACYNYLYSIYVLLNKLKGTDTTEDLSIDCKGINDDFRWIYEFTLGEIEAWDEDLRNKYLGLLADVGRMLEKNVSDLLLQIQDATDIRLDGGMMLYMMMDSAGENKNEDNHEEPETIVRYRVIDADEDENIIHYLRSYMSRPLADKSKLLAECSISIEGDVDWDGAFLLKAVINTCRTIKGSVPYLLEVNKLLNAKGKGSKQSAKVMEDHVSILFRECFNMAYTELFNITAAVQQKTSATGNIWKQLGVESPAEVDMMISSVKPRSDRELFEAFVLGKSSGKATYKDHMAKVLGNDVDYRSPVFMLVYSVNDSDTIQKKWESYRKYLLKLFEKDYASAFGGKGIHSSIKDMESSNCVVKNFSDDFCGFDIIRQLVNFNGHEIEIFHILLELNHSYVSEIRKLGRKKQEKSKER